MGEKQPFGIAVLDVYQNQWALWQVSVDSFSGRLRASKTNAVVRDRFNRAEFEALVGNRHLLMTPRAEVFVPEGAVDGPTRFSGEDFVSMSESWIDHLDGLFRTENERRLAENKAQAEAKKSGQITGPLKKLSPLQDPGWPGAPDTSAWSSDLGCELDARAEALRLADGCVRLLDYWLDIEVARTKKNRTYFHGVGGPEVRTWPSPAPEEDSSVNQLPAQHTDIGSTPSGREGHDALVHSH
ncbi:hypothetical protein GCM10009688_22880 [Arthrobacter gandavensis]|uniref:Uncharacterized protein n=1 Tax=Arthrobacter gandavensis TaxID=169960 RepID=A0ABN2PCN5_9MICC|nr:hypothetical protein [Arthrobacter citreus]